MNDLSQLTEKANSIAASKAAIGSKLKFSMGSDGVIFIDGTGDKNVVSNEDLESTATVVADFETVSAILNGELTGSGAYFQGKLVVEGDLAVAMEIESLIE